MAEDLVNHLPHYEKGGIETIDFIKAKGLYKDFYLIQCHQIYFKSKV